MHRLIIPALLLTLSGCAKAGGYPSLNPRPIEAKAADLLEEPSLASAQLAPATAEAKGKIEAALASAQTGRAEFDRALPATRATVARAGASGSESWIEAQTAISALERSRAPVKTALSDLDGLLRAALAGPPGEDLGLIESAIRTVEQIDSRQEDAMTALLRAVSR